MEASTLELKWRSMDDVADRSAYRWTAASQAGLFLITGAWPLVSRSSFELVMGHKVDFWLVRTVGSLLTVVGGVLALASARAPRAEIALLAAGSSMALAAIDVRYATERRISRVYLLDAIVEAGFAAAWAYVFRRAFVKRTRVREPIEWRRVDPLKDHDDERVTCASEDSFPASDPPGWGSSAIT